MKKAAAVLLAGLMVLSMAACGNKEENKETTKTAGKETTKAAGTETTKAAEDSESESKDSGKLIMATEAGFAPYEYTEDGETVMGVDVDIAQEIAKAMGKELEVQNMTFDGALLAVQQGKVDFAAAGISISPDREKQMDFSIEYTTSKQVVVVNKNANRVASTDDLTADTVVGVQTGTVADIYCQDDLGTKDLKQYGKFMEAAMDLKNDKIDCIIMDALPAEEMVKENDDLAVLDKEVFTDRYAIAVKKGNTELLEQINEVLQKLVDEGKVEEFIVNHTTK
ncbi:ABC transporter substrate-binding protein [Lacrimispora sp. NSJ-141]|uniref:ABC transporter substrate-binding protein n=1 Tax=Lientehia hominis TaxID=2897778 RepID=A0AAP2W7W9_9FIRM|nr:ABC transporter substrate-binding protein [Lientehia hominis]MCD2491411.1 ABC transporter substrate-binding protein [Lientehia hominis]